jgi:hypothetical protein
MSEPTLRQADEEDLLNLIDMLWGETPLDKESHVLEIALAEHTEAWHYYEDWVESNYDV